MPGMHSKSLLFVDDDPVLRSSLPPALESAELSVETAASLEQAQALLEQRHFDLVITDLRLSGSQATEGMELIRWLRLRSPEQLVVLITAFGSREIEHRARRLGAADYWQKSIPIPEILLRLRALGLPAG